MKKIGLLSDTHGYLDESILDSLEGCDEIWHAGDIGNLGVVEKLQKIGPLRAVYGNIDGWEIRKLYPEWIRFDCEGLNVLMIHIGGYPGKYSKYALPLLQEFTPGLFISGHSHILKIITDRSRGMLHINPGACGQEGFHKIRTIVRFSIHATRLSNMEVVELGMRGALKRDSKDEH
jgi:hypothetical protein